MNRDSSCMRMFQGKLSRTALPFANLQCGQIVFAEQLTLNSLGDGDPGVFLIVDRPFSSGSYRMINVLSVVTLLLRKFSLSRSNRWTKWRHDSALWAFWHSDSILGIHLAHNLLIFKFLWIIIVCTVPTLQSIRWLTTLTMKRLSLSRSSLISWIFCDVIDVGRPLFVHHNFVSIFIPQVSLMQCRSLYCSIAVHFHSFFSVFSIENTEINRCSLYDAHFHAPCINKMAANAQMT